MSLDDRRLGKRVARVVGLATLIVSLAACALRSPPPTAENPGVVTDNQAHAQEAGRTQGTLSEAAVPPSTPPSIVASRDRSSRSGVLLAVEWAAADGSRISRSPDRGDAVRWVPIDGAADQVIEFRLQIGIPATRLDLRAFATEINARGIPEGEPLIVICVAKDNAVPGGACTTEIRDGVTIIRWRPSTRVRYVVVSGVWHIPASAQGPEGMVDDSASWGFGPLGIQ